MERFIPHMHTCEVKLCFHQTWRDKCPLHGELTETEDECEACPHFITVNCDPKDPAKITGIVRDDREIPATQRQSA